MKLNAKLAIIPTVLALGASPALAVAAGKPATAGPQTTHPTQAKSYGVYCKNESKQHVAGQKGTPFSQCVTAMAKLASGKTSSPRSACATESKKHVAGQKGTPFSQCVSAAAKLKADQETSGPDEDTSNS